MFCHQFINSVDEIAGEFNLKPHLLQRWAKTRPHQAKMYDLAYRAIKNNPDAYQAIIETETTIKNYHDVNKSLGLPKIGMGMEWSPFPEITMRKWLKDCSRDFNISMIGLQQIKLEELKDRTSDKQVSKAYKAGLTDADLVSLYIANEDASVALVNNLR